MGTGGFMLLPVGSALANTGKRADEEKQKVATGVRSVNVLVKVATSVLGVRARMLEDNSQSLAKRQRTQGWNWEGNKSLFFHKDDSMTFEKCDQATKQLQAIHESTFYRAMDFAGDKWEIPIVDNVCDLGKSSFGQNYIKKCQQKWPGEADASAKKFMPVLRACHTINIALPSDLLFAENNPDYNKVQIRMIELICAFFDRNFEARPRAFNPKLVESMKTTWKLLKKLTAEVGPLFIVLEEAESDYKTSDRNVDDLVKRQ
ncbi:hypothetical protein P3T76_013471 [Phytophthora citrophthora]|uniref:Uncharacterized protein n=1 Tax=Phytophthora citrophthora TaxID=4793 RepID=A0AAD9G3R2_9STRA|nr:hypothetical protein P3T76_013471 [Phytophthora citrophthora]